MNKDYSGVDKGLHWATALLLVTQYVVGFTMPEIHKGTQPEILINTHLSLGALIILVVLARLVWRLIHPVPPLGGEGPKVMMLVSRIMHGLIYILMIVVPVLGWANANARGWHVGVWGVVPLPDIRESGDPLGRKMGDIHMMCSYVLIGLVSIHVLAALYHHFVAKDRVLARMLPTR